MNKPFFYLTNYIIHGIKNSVPHQEKGVATTSPAGLIVLNMGNWKLPLALMALFFSLFLLNSVSALLTPVECGVTTPVTFFNSNEYIGGNPVFFPTYTITHDTDNMYFDGIGNSTTRKSFFIISSPWTSPNPVDKWVNINPQQVYRIDYDINIRDTTSIDSRLVFQLTHEEYDIDNNTYEWGRYMSGNNLTFFGTNLTALGIGKHHISELVTTCWFWNQTSDEEILYDVCPSNWTYNANLDTVNLLASGYGNGSDWNLNLTVGNITITGVSSSNSPDCAIPISNISSLYANLSNFLNIVTGRQFIKINVTNVNSQQSMEGCIRGTLRMQDLGNCWGFVDSSSPLILQGFNHIVREESEPVYYMERMLLDNQHPSIYTGEIVQVVGLLTNSYLDNYYLNTSNQLIPDDMYIYVYNITPLGTAPSGYAYYDTYSDYTAVPSTTNRYGLTTYNLNPVSVIYYYTRYNSTHLTRTNMNTGATLWILVNAKFINTTVNTTYYLFQYPNFEAYLDGSPLAYMFTTVFDSRYNNTSPIKIISYETMVNQSQNNTSNRFYYIYNVMLTEHNNLNIIGDGICGSLESDIPSDWNYSPDCRFGGLSGYASAVGAKSMQMFTLFLGVVFLILSVLVPLLMRSDLTTELIIMSAVGILISIPLIVVGLSFIITP